MSGRIFAGLLLILLGALFLADAAGVADFGSLWGTYWPVILIVLGIGVIAGNLRRPAGGIVLLLLGLFFLGSELGYLPGNWFQYLWPLLIIFIGIGILFGSRHRRVHREEWRADHKPTFNDADALHTSILFSGVDEIIRTKTFRGGDVEATFGGARLDLRQAGLAPEGATLNLSATFGGIDLFLPADWRVAVNSKPFLGGVSNQAASSPAAGGPLLTINASATFGGVTIKN